MPCDHGQACACRKASGREDPSCLWFYKGTRNGPKTNAAGAPVTFYGGPHWDPEHNTFFDPGFNTTFDPDAEPTKGQLQHVWTPFIRILILFSLLAFMIGAAGYIIWGSLQGLGILPE